MKSAGTDVANTAGRGFVSITGAKLYDNTRIDPIYNGENYYEAELAAMKAAQPRRWFG